MGMGIRTKKYALIALLTILFLLGVGTAFLTYRYYGVVVRGITGLVLMYMLFFASRHSKMDVSIDNLLLDPRKGKYLIAAFILPIISYWATLQIMEMILFFGKR